MFKSPTWQTSKILITLRWIFFIPAGWMLHTALIILTTLLMIWLFDNSFKTLVLHILMPTALNPIPIVLFIGLLAFLVSLLAVSISPNKQIASIAYGVIHSLNCVFIFISSFNSSKIDVPISCITVIIVLICGLYGIVHSYRESLKSLPQNDEMFIN